MWTRRCPHRAIIFSLVLALATANFAIGAKSEPKLDIQLKLVNDGNSPYTNVDSITICITLPEVQEMAPTEDDFLLTLSDSNRNTITEDKSTLQNHKEVCFNSQADYSKFDMEEPIGVVIYKRENEGNKRTQIYKLFSENIKLLVPKTDALNGDLVLVQWNNTDGQLFSLEDKTDDSFFKLCKTQLCQFIIERSSQQSKMHLVIQSENKIIIQTIEIEIGVKKGYTVFEIVPTQINYINQSIDFSTGNSFQMVEIEAPDLLPAKCIFIQMDAPNRTQTNNTCNGWDGSKMAVKNLHAEFTAELEEIKYTIIAHNGSIDNMGTVLGANIIKFKTFAFATSVAIIGSNFNDTDAFLRVSVGSNEEAVSIDDETCSAGGTCYYPYSQQNIKERSKIIKVEGGNEEIKHYDDSIIPFRNLDEISEVKLVNEKILDIAKYETAPNNSFVVFVFKPNENNNNGELECSYNIEDPISCNLEPNFDMTENEKLNIVVIMLDPNNKVAESTSVVLEDLKINVKMFTLSSLKVTWKGNSDEHYILDIEPVLNSYKSLNTLCTFQLENCVAFFTDVENKIKYTLSVKKPGSITKVAQTITTDDDTPDQPSIMISKVIECNGTKLVTDPSQLSQVDRIEVSVTRLAKDEIANQTIIKAQNLGDGKIYSSNFVTNPEDENAFNDWTELLLLGYDENDDIIATSYLKYQYIDILVNLTYVGNSSDSMDWSLHVVPLGEDLNITDSICTNSGACYIIEPESKEICIEGVSDTDAAFKQCDETQEPEEFLENDKISTVILQNEQEVVITSKEDPEVKNTEIYLYYTDDNADSGMDVQDCNDLTSCSITVNIPEEEYLMKILIVSLNGENMVLKSSLILFEDLKLNFTELTSDILETNWHHGVNTDNYLIHLSSSTQSFIRNDLKSTCTNNDRCTAIFSHIDQGEYIFTVQKKGEDMTKVAKTVTFNGDAGDDSGNFSVSNVIESNGCTKITLEKSKLYQSLTELGVSITSMGDNELPQQTFEPGTKMSEDNDSVVYSIPFVFDSSKKKQDDQTEMVLVGLNEHSKVIASAELNFTPHEFSSKIDPVGASLNDDDHSVRIILAEGESLQNSTIMCTNENPCYFIEPKRTIPICSQNTDDVNLCTDASSKFIAMNGAVSVEISDDGLVQVSTKLSDIDNKLEVVAYDDNNPHNILSKDDSYNCKPKNIKESKYSCSQEVKVTKDLKTVWVLVVEISEMNKSVVHSTKKRIQIHSDKSTEVWVIVMSSIGAIFGVIFIISAILVTWKKLSTKKEEGNLTSQENNVRREKNTNVHNENDYQDRDDLDMSQLRSQDNYRDETAYDNPVFDHNINNKSDLYPAHGTNIAFPNNFEGNYAPSNNANFTNNVIQNWYAEPEYTHNGARGRPNSFEVPRTNHQNPHARPRHLSIQNDNFRNSSNISTENSYNRTFEPAHSSALKPPMRAKEPVHARLSRDKATTNALQRVPLGPLPRIPVHPSRIQHYKAIRETTVIPPHGNWDVEI